MTFQTSPDAYVYKGGTLTLMSRLPTLDATDYLVPTDISTITMTVYKLTSGRPDERTAVTGQTDVSVTPADVMFSSLQTDALWTVDTTGYNFRHTPDVSTTAAFTEIGATYHVEYTLMPVTGQVIILRFVVGCE